MGIHCMFSIPEISLEPSNGKTLFLQREFINRKKLRFTKFQKNGKFVRRKNAAISKIFTYMSTLVYNSHTIQPNNNNDNHPTYHRIFIKFLIKKSKVKTKVKEALYMRFSVKLHRK